MLRRIAVSSNCQTGGIAAALQKILPRCTVHAVPLPSFGTAEEEMAFIHNTTAEVDCWVTTHWHERAEDDLLKHKDFRLVKIPCILFSGFHPDLVYARNTSTSDFTKYHYNSAICLWAYKHGLEPRDAKSLFTHDVFSELGYFSCWDIEAKALESSFKSSDIDFAQFFLHVKRRGMFMHSYNHPLAFVLVRLAQLIAVHLGESESLLGQTIIVPDGLAGAAWPVYPEIADYYALDGGAYEWMIEGKYYSGLDEYIHFAYQNYHEQGIGPDNLEICRDEALLDRVLREKIGAALS